MNLLTLMINVRVSKFYKELIEDVYVFWLMTKDHPLGEDLYSV